MTIRNAIRGLVAAALAAVAVQAQAFDYHGYFRDTVGFNSKGGSQVCFQLPGSAFKARLGNECDRYLEFGFGEGGKYESIEWRVEFMPASYQPTASGSSGNPSVMVQQIWLGLKFNDWGGAQIWAGRRYWKRHDVHSLDWFYWNPAQGNAGAGIEDINLGFGKLAVSVFRIDANPGSPSATNGNLTQGTYAVPDIRVYGIPVNPNGTLEAGIDIGIAYDQKVGTPATSALGANRAGTSPLFTIQHNQSQLLGGSNTLAFQYGQGAFASENGDGPGQIIAGGTKDDKQWRIIEHLVVNPVPNFSGALVLVYQDISTPTPAGGGINGRKIFTGEVRPAFSFTNWFKLEGDFFYQTISYKNAPSGVGSPSLFKFTAAPTFVLGTGYWARPVVRLFLTYGSWNTAAVTAGGVASGAFGTSKNGTTFGVNVETWF